jgi:hypothetical protein
VADLFAIVLHTLFNTAQHNPTPFHIVLFLPTTTQVLYVGCNAQTGLRHTGYAHGRIVPQTDMTGLDHTVHAMHYSGETSHEALCWAQEMIVE